MQPASSQDGKSDKWRSQIAEERRLRNLPSSVKVWSPFMQATGLRVTERISEILDVFAASKLSDLGANLFESTSFSEKKKLLEHQYCDVSQNPKYKSCTNQIGITGCLATSTVLYSFGRDRLILPFELALLQGHRRGIKFPDSMSSSQIRDLMGEGMHLACLGTVVWCLCLTKGLI